MDFVKVVQEILVEDQEHSFIEMRADKTLLTALWNCIPVLRIRHASFKG